MFFAATVLLAALQTDFGVRVPPGVPVPDEPNVKVIRRKQNPVKPKPSGAFACRVQSVHDGDTFRCADGTRIRLSAIDTPEMPGACQPRRRCAPGDPYAAKAALQRLIGGKTVQCEPAGKSYDRVAAWCSVNGVDLSCAMIRNGQAIELPQYNRDRRLCR